MPWPQVYDPLHNTWLSALLAALTAAANSSGGGVMGKMTDAQSIVVASTATQWYSHEGDVLRYVFSTAWLWPGW
jgi:L-lactate permease